MNAAGFRERIKFVAEYAMKREPTDIDARARAFVAGLSGRLACEEPALAAMVWAMLERPDSGQGYTPTAGSAG
jgi:hypothetical protein